MKIKRLTEDSSWNFNLVAFNSVSFITSTAYIYKEKLNNHEGARHCRKPLCANLPSRNNISRTSAPTENNKIIKITLARLLSLLCRPSGENDFMIGYSPSSIKIVDSCRACPGQNFRFPCCQIPLFNSIVRSGI